MKPVEAPGTSHDGCQTMHANGWTDAQIVAWAEGRGQQPASLAFWQTPARSLTFWETVIAVILGMTLFSVLAWILHFISH